MVRMVHICIPGTAWARKFKALADKIVWILEATLKDFPLTHTYRTKIFIVTKLHALVYESQYSSILLHIRVYISW